MELRDYQIDLVESVWRKLFEKNKVLVVAPCGAGKTECFIALCKRAIKSKSDIKILILLNKVDLVEQTARRVAKVISDVGVICSTLDSFDEKQVTVASIQTVSKVNFGKINLIIADEAQRMMDYMEEEKNLEGILYLQQFLIKKVEDLTEDAVNS